MTTSPLPLTHRLAVMDDLPELHSLMNRAIAQLQTPFLTAKQIEASYKVMGLDTQLVRDGTYFVVESEGLIVGCGGWSFRATLFGGDASIVARDANLLDPATDAVLDHVAILPPSETLVATFPAARCYADKGKWFGCPAGLHERARLDAYAVWKRQAGIGG